MLAVVDEQLLPDGLAARLPAAGVDAETEPRQAWLRLRQVEGRRATVVDLYELSARRRGLRAEQLPHAERAELAAWAMPTV